MEYIVDFFISITLIVESIYDRENKLSKWKDTLIQIIYSLIISFVLGFIGIIFIIVILGIFNRQYIEQGVSSILVMSTFVFIIFMWIILYNHKEEDFRFSKSIISVFALTLNIGLKKILIQSLIYIVVMPLVLSILGCLILMCTDIGYNKYPIIIILMFIVSLILYSEFKVNKLERSIRQCVLWSIIFIAVLGLNLYQYDFLLESESIGNEQMVSFILSILGLAFTSTTIVDKTRNMYEELNRKLGTSIQDKINILKGKYNYEKIVKYFNGEVKEVRAGAIIIKEQWKKGERCSVIMRAMILILGLGIIIIMGFNQEQVSLVVSEIVDGMKNIFIMLFNGDKEIAKRVLTIGIVLIINIYYIYKFYIEFKHLSIKQKLDRTIGMMIFLTALLVVVSSCLEGVALKSMLYVIGRIPFVILILYIIQIVISKNKNKNESDKVR